MSLRGGRLSFFILASALICLSLPSVDSSWIYSNPTVSDYVDDTVEVEESYGEICYIKDSSGNKTYYTRIEKAVEIANNAGGGDVYVIPDLGTNIEVSNSFTISSGTTLYLPYGYDDSGNELLTCDSSVWHSWTSYDGFTDRSTSLVNSNRKVLITMTGGADITIASGGNLIIGGEFGTFGVRGNYSEICLDIGSCITADGGSLTSYGFIKEGNYVDKTYNVHSDEDSESRYVSAVNGGTVEAIMCVYDFDKSGGTLKGLLDENVCPISIFDFPNIQTKVNIDYQSYFITNVRAYKSITFLGVSYVADVDTKVYIVAPKSYSSAAIFYSGNSGLSSFEYVPYTSTGLTPVDSAANRNYTYVTVETDITMGYLYMKLSDAIGTIDTRNYFTPISHKLQIDIASGGSFTSGYKLKFYGGSTLTIEENASFYVNSDLVFYPQNTLNTMTSTSGVSSWLVNIDSNEGASLINNGSIVVGSSGKIGGYIQNTTSTSGLAKIDLSSMTNSDNLSVSSAEGSIGLSVSVATQASFYTTADYGVRKCNLQVGNVFYSTDSVNVWSGNYVLAFTLYIIADPGDLSCWVYTYSIDIDGTTASQEVHDGSASAIQTSVFSLEQGSYFTLTLSRYTSASAVDSTGASVTKPLNEKCLADDYTIYVVPKKAVKFTGTVTGASSGYTRSSATLSESSTSSGTYTTLQSKSDGFCISEGRIIEGFYFKYSGFSLIVSGTTKWVLEIGGTQVTSGSFKFLRSFAVSYQASGDIVMTFTHS